MKKNVTVVLITLLILVLTGCAGDGNENTDQVTIGFFPNVSHAPGIVALEKGLFAQELEGIEPDIQTFPNGSLFMDALSTGQIDFGYVGPGPVLNRYMQGGDVIALAGASKGENVLAVRKDFDYSKLSDLEGKIIATPSTGCTHDLILRRMLQEEGLAVEENGGTVKRIVQKPAAMAGLFAQKQIDAAVVNEPWASIMEAQGLIHVVREADEIPWKGNLPAAVLVAKRDFLAANPGLVYKLLAANEQAVNFINNNKAETVRLLADRIKKITGEQIAEDIIAGSMARIRFSTDLNQSTMQEFADLSRELGFVQTDPDLAGLYDIK